MAFGSLVPGMAPMQAPPMQQGGLFGAGLGQQGMNVLMSALRQRGGGATAPQPLNLLSGAAQPGLLSQWLNPAPAPGVIPNAGAAGPMPNALTGLW